VFQDETGYYLKTKNCFGTHQYHAHCDHLRTSISLLEEQDLQIQEDLNSSLGMAVNLHYAHSAQEGTPTVLSQQQIAHLCKKKDMSNLDGEMEEGETADDMYSFLEHLGNYYVSLLSHGTPATSS
jgi:hypothetical protein